MAFDVQPITDDIADSILVWCGVSDPTPAQVSLAEIASASAQNAIRFYRRLDTAPAWEGEVEYALYDVVRPTHPNEHIYRCTTAGTSYETEPTWPTGEGSTVADDTVVWTEYTPPFEEKYTSLAIEMGSYLYQKRGVDGTTSFGENGVQRSFEKGSFPPSMLTRIVLPAKVG